MSRYARVPRAEGYDELFDSGGPRPDWKPLVDALETMGREELMRRWEVARALLHEHGVSYDVYGDPQGVARPWNLSPIPVVMGAAAWSRIASGLEQRARLLDLVLADLYGPRRLLAEGDLPPEIVFAHPGFLRPCAGIVPAGGRYLPLYAADLVRRQDGEIAVLADRTQAPSGIGYALENRIIVARSLPDVFRDLHVARLATFFRTLRDTLRRFAPHNRDNPRIVLLTPGPYNATYFEQAFLAQYLDLTLARGDDLVVRDRRLHLKTLGGLRSIDVVLRRVNDAFCDPLELRQDSALGVPGLVEAVRSGNVAVANPLGSGVIQTAAIMPFLPGLCGKLLGEELKLPSVRTHWCGDPEGLAYVIEHLAELVIKPAFPVGPTAPAFGPELSAGELDEWRARLRARPRHYVAQDCVVLSTAPTLVNDELTPAPLWMRAYLVASGEHEYEAMPGALSRIGRPEESLALSLRPGGESKDTWVVAGGPVSTYSLLPSASAPIELSRSGGDLPSRVADNLFWLGRYAARAEATARLARAVAVRLSDHGASEGETAAHIDVLLSALEGRSPRRRPLVAPVDADRATRAAWAAAAEEFLLASVFEQEAPGTLQTALSETHRVARSIRDWISSDTWRSIARWDEELPRPEHSGPRTLAGLVTMLNQIVILLAAFNSLAADSMTHGYAWRFLDMGRRLERSMQLVALLRAALAVPCTRETSLLEALLDIADGSMTYRRRYLATLQVAPVVDLLLTDETNPRSALFQLVGLAGHIEALPRDPSVPRTPPQSLVLSAMAELRLADVGELCSVAQPCDRAGLLTLLDRVGRLLPTLSNSLSSAYLNHAGAPRQMTADLAGAEDVQSPQGLPGTTRS